MATHQTGHNIIVAYKVEVTFNTAVSGASGYQFRPNSGGLKLTRALIESKEIRSDGKTPMGRLGSKSVTGTYAGELSLGTFDPLFEAVMRSTFTTLSITQATASLVSVIAGADTHTLQCDVSGNWFTGGVMVGDVFRLTNFATSADNSINLRVTGVATITLTVMETLVTNTAPDTTFTLVRGKKVIQGTTPTRRSWTFDEYDADLDLSKVASGCRISSMKITGQPDGMAMVEFGIVGADLTPLASGASPSLTSPTLTTSIALTWADAVIRVGANSRTNLTAFELMIDMSAKGQPVIGSSTTPDVFENNSKVTGSISSTLTDFSDLTNFTAETEFEFHALLTEPESEPKDYISLFFARGKLTAFDDSIGQDGPKIVTLPFMVGTKGSGVAGYDDSMIILETSAA